MASELKLEIFAYNLFHNLWNMYKVTETMPNILEVYGDECSKVNDYMEVLNSQFHTVVFIRRSIFKNIYGRELTEEKIGSWKSPLDCSDYILSTCDRDDLFGHLTVFQRMFATVTFVLIVCLRMHEFEHIIDIVKYGHIFWLMYFDKFTQEFYEKGGWEELKIETKSYAYLFDFFWVFQKCIFNIQKIKQSIDNYFHFKNVVIWKEQKYKHPTRISKLWITFRMENLGSYIKIPLSFEIFVKATGAENLLEDLKLVFYPLRRNSELCFTYEEMKDDDTGVQLLNFDHESRIIDKVSDEFSNINPGFKNQNGEKCAVSKKEVLTFDTANKNDNFKFEKNTSTEMDSAKQIITVDSTENLQNEQDLELVVNRNKRSETSIKKSINATDSDQSCRSKFIVKKCEDDIVKNFSKGNTEKQHEIASQVISINNMDEKTSPEKVFALKDFRPVNENDADSDQNSRSISFVNKCKDDIVENCCKGNTEKQHEIASQVISINKMDENTSPEKVSALKDFRPVTENVSSDDKRKKEDREDLRNEQKNPEMKNFLKMLLVLDDKEEIKFVLSTLQNNKGGTENSQENTNKQKKKSKKKKFKKIL